MRSLSLTSIPESYLILIYGTDDRTLSLVFLGSLGLLWGVVQLKDFLKEGRLGHAEALKSPPRRYYTETLEEEYFKKNPS